MPDRKGFLSRIQQNIFCTPLRSVAVQNHCFLPFSRHKIKQTKMLLAGHHIAPVGPSVRICVALRIPRSLKPLVLPCKNDAARIAGIVNILHHGHKHFSLLGFRLIALVKSGINIGMRHTP